MKPRHIESTLMVASLTLIIGVLAACSQTRDTAALPPSAGPADVSTADGRVVIDQRQLTQPLGQPTYRDGQGAPTYYDDMQQSRTTSVRAPLVHLDVDRGSGAVHLNTPFVRVDTAGRGRGAVIDVPPARQDYGNGYYADPNQ